MVWCVLRYSFYRFVIAMKLQFIVIFFLFCFVYLFSVDSIHIRPSELEFNSTKNSVAALFLYLYARRFINRDYVANIFFLYFIFVQFKCEHIERINLRHKKKGKAENIELEFCSTKNKLNSFVARKINGKFK